MIKICVAKGCNRRVFGHGRRKYCSDKCKRETLKVKAIERKNKPKVADKPKVAIQLSEDQERVMKLYNSGEKFIGVFGSAGSGKTRLLNEIVDQNEGKKGKGTIVVAPTGVAAINCGSAASTIHSMFRIPYHAPWPPNDPRFNLSLTKVFKLNSKRITLLERVNTIIIDEISMVRCDLLDVIDHILRKIGDPFEPFGGKRVIVFGDPMQLPPIVSGNDAYALRPHYKSSWFFNSNVWGRSKFKCIRLRNIFRQTDNSFISILNKIRDGVITEDEIEEINNKHYEPLFKNNEYVRLSTHNYKVDNINKRELNAIQEPETVYHASVNGKFPESMYPLCPGVLKLKVGARVMFVKNDKSTGVVNGTIGTVVDLYDHSVFVKLKDGSVIEVLPEVWENFDFQVKGMQINTRKIGTYIQMPLKLAFAITTHKSQGLGFDKAILDLEGSFAFGQVYVAMSRMTNMEGMVFASELTKDNVKVDPRVVDFYRIVDAIQ